MKLHSTNNKVSVLPKASFFGILLLCLFSNSSAQFHAPHFSRIDKGKGAETSFPMDVAVDKDYRYWIATFNGLMEYNGTSFKNYQMPFSQNGILGSAYLFRLCFENDSILWIAHGGGIAKFDIYRKQFELVPIPHIPANTSLNFIESFKDSEGKLFFISTQLKLLYYDAKEKCVKPFGEIDQSKTGFIFKVSESKDKKYYLFHSKKGLLLFDKKKKCIVTAKESPAEYKWFFRKEFQCALNDFAEIGEQKYISLLDTVTHLYSVIKFNERTNEFGELPIKSNKGRLFFVDSFNKLWIYGFGGKDEACLHDPVTNTSYLLPDKEINSSEVDFSLCYKIVEDHENNIWLCTNTGLLTYNHRQSNYTIISKDLPKNIYSYIEQIDSSHIWFGTLFNGIYEYDVRTRTFKNYNFLKSGGDISYNDIWQTIKTKKGDQIWILHQEGKITRYDVNKKKFYHYNDTLFNGDAMSFSDDDEGHSFFVTTEGRIITYDKKTDQFRLLLHLNQVEGISEDIEVSDVVGIGDKTLILSTSGEGLIKFDLNTRTYKVIRVNSKDPTSVRSNIINMMMRADKQLIYAGTTNGIFSYNANTDSIHNYNYSDRYNLGFVYQIANDKNEDYLYFIGTSKLYWLNWKTKDIIDLGRRSNIERANLTEICYSSNLNKLYVISEESIYEVQVNQSEFSTDLKPILYSLESYDKIFYIKNDGEIFLEHGFNSFRLSYGASTYRYKDDLEYFYDFDNSGWIPALTNEIAFSNLRGGDHLFKLKLVYKGNRSISHETSFTIHLKKKFHETVWFYLLIALLILTFFYTLYRIRINRLLAVEKVRFQLSRDLHDDMGSTLSTINILSEMAKNKLAKEPITAQNYLEKISTYSQVMMDSMDDIVWSINPGNDTMSKVLNRMREFANNILEAKDIELIFVTSSQLDELKLNMALRRDFFLIFKEAINNAAKYAECTKVKVELSVKNKQLLLSIMDNGKGFEWKKESEGNGLMNMKKRAEKIKAQFELNSSANEGTRIELRLNLNLL
ncbi:hypothetical protein CNR22_11350 [Sphingobacteriaceae bacterium]|nr:hypothetical protein CNR22_11350 [Sphingobacteriaceae bacterium]